MPGCKAEILVYSRFQKSAIKYWSDVKLAMLCYRDQAVSKLLQRGSQDWSLDPLDIVVKEVEGWGRF